MAATAILNVDEFNKLYAHEHGYEYWFGQVVRKPVPNRLHGILQVLLGQILFEYGYIAASEVDVRISRSFQPRPDLIGTLDYEDSSPYPRKPFDIVIEVLSLNDPNNRTLEKCALYADLGIEQIYVFDAEARGAFQWNTHEGQLLGIDELVLTNGKHLPVCEVFARLDQRLFPGAISKPKP